MMPIPQALAGLAVDLIDQLRGPLQLRRARNLAAISNEAKVLRAEQGVEEPKILPPKVINQFIEDGSFVEDEDLRTLWTQLLVNAQAGMAVEAYLVEILGKLNGHEVDILQRLKRRSEGGTLNVVKEKSVETPGVDSLFAEWGPPNGSEDTAKLLALGLVSEEYASRSQGAYYDHPYLGTSSGLEFTGYRIAPLGERLLCAVQEPPVKSPSSR